MSAELAALRAFRDAVDVASLVYHAGAGSVGGMTLPDVAFERAVRIALTALQDELDALHAYAARAGEGGAQDERGGQ